MNKESVYCSSPLSPPRYLSTCGYAFNSAFDAGLMPHIFTARGIIISTGAGVLLTIRGRFWRMSNCLPLFYIILYQQVSFHLKLKNIGKMKVLAKILSGFWCLQSTEAPLTKVTNDLLLAANKGLHCAPSNSLWPCSCSCSAFDRRDPKVYSTIRDSYYQWRAAVLIHLLVAQVILTFSLLFYCSFCRCHWFLLPNE